MRRMLRSIAATSTTSAGVEISDTRVGRRLAILVVIPTPRRNNAETAHLAVQVASLHAQQLGGAGDVSLLRGERTHDVLAFKLITCLVQRAHHDRFRPCGL